MLLEKPLSAKTLAGAARRTAGAYLCEREAYELNEVGTTREEEGKQGHVQHGKSVKRA